MTRRRWNERECEVGGTTRRRLVSILFPISREADKIHAAMLTIRKRDGRFNVARHGGIPEGVFGCVLVVVGRRGRRTAGLVRNKGCRTRKEKRAGARV